MSLLSQICAYVTSKTKSATVDIVLHAKVFVQISELFDTHNVPKDTRVNNSMYHIACALRKHFLKQPPFQFEPFNVSKLIFSWCESRNTW